MPFPVGCGYAASAWLKIDWLDEPVRIEATVLTADQGMQPFALPTRSRHGGQIDGLLGRQLLARGARLDLDYVAKSAKILKSVPLAGGT